MQGTQGSTLNPIAEVQNGVWDFKSYIEPYLMPVQGHSKYSVFRFTSDSNGQVELHYKV